MANSVSSITVTGTTSESGATVGGQSGQSITLIVGTSIVTVTASDDITIKNYVVTVTRAASSSVPTIVYTIDNSNYDPASLSDADVTKAASLDVYFEHASVGGYIVGPIPDWPSNGLAALQAASPRYAAERATWGDTSSAIWFDSHNGLGDNSRGNPGADAKISGFISSMNASSGLLPTKIDVAMFKFCYIDSPSDASTLFNSTKTAMESLQISYPSVAFVWWTMPIETSGNAEKQSYNDQVRAYCIANNQWLFDIASIESHNDAGVHQLDGSSLELLDAGHSADGGHPNDAGTLKLAKGYWKLIVEIGKTR